MTPPFTREDLLRRLDELGLRHTTIDHAPVYRVSETHEIDAALPGAHTKNLFLKDRKGRLFLLTALARSPVDLKAAAGRLGATRFSFASEDRLYDALGVRPGSVTPFALVNDPDRAVAFVLDETLRAHQVWNFHPLRNDATTAISQQDFLTFLKSLGRAPNFAAFGPTG